MKLSISNPENVKLPLKNSVNIFIDSETSTLRGKRSTGEILEFSKTIEVEPDFSSMGITVTSEDVKTGKYFIDLTGTLVEGSLNESSYSINDNQVTLTNGFIDETQTIQVGTLYSGSTELTPSIEDQTLNADTFISNQVVIKGDANFTEENIAEGVTLWGKTGTHKGGSIDTEKVGVLVEGTDGTLMFQELTFDGTTPTDNGDPVAIEGTYLYNTGKDEPDYGGGESGGGSMEIYQCVDAEGMTWIVVSGAGSTEANGRYYRGDDVWSDSMMGFYAQYFQKDGACTFFYTEGRWQLKSGSTILYVDESYEYHDGDPSQCTGWAVSSGTEPVPTVTTETTTGNGWTGKLYDPETQTVADTETALTYSYTAPQIGKFYTSDGDIECDVFGQSGLVFSKTFNDDSMLCPTKQTLSLYAGTKTVTTNQGVPCWQLDGSTAFSCDDSNFPMGNNKRSISIFTKCSNFIDSHVIFGYGTISSKQRFAVAYTTSTIFAYALGNTCQIEIPEEYTNSVNNWIHLAFCYENYQTTFYLNGVLLGTVAFPIQEINTQPAKALIGCNDGGNYDVFFDGYISEVKVWNRILTPEEIAAEAQRCLAMVTE